MLPIRTYLQGAGVDHFLALGVTEATIRQSNDPDEDQDDPDNTRRLHAQTSGRLKRPPALQQIDDQDDDRDHDQNVDQAAADMHGESQKPENEKNDADSPEHIFLWLKLAFLRARPRRCAYC